MYGLLQLTVNLLPQTYHFVRAVSVFYVYTGINSQSLLPSLYNIEQNIWKSIRGLRYIEHEGISRI